jgi:hypothetical protein
MTCAQEIHWTELNGDRHNVSSGWHGSLEAARWEALQMAKAFGWTPPRWWQFWRWNDTRL